MHKLLSKGLLSAFPFGQPNQSQNQNQGKPQKGPGCYLVVAVVSFIMIIIFKAIDNKWQTNLIPYSLFEFWHCQYPLIEGVKAAMPLFYWGVLLKTLDITFRSDSSNREIAENITPAQLLGGGILMSVFAGVFEEISFRWIMFFDSIVANKLINYLLLGFMDHGIVKWLFLHWGAPITNWVTFDLFYSYIHNPLGWSVGAAMIAINATFRDGHKYQGPIGWLNSWYVGFFLFWIMFNYGLLNAIIAHAIYDLLVTGEEFLYFSYYCRKHGITPQTE